MSLYKDKYLKYKKKYLELKKMQGGGVFKTLFKCIASVGLIVVAVAAIAVSLTGVGAIVGVPVLVLTAKGWDELWDTKLVTTGGSSSELIESINKKMDKYIGVNKKYNNEYYTCILKNIIMDNIKVTSTMEKILKNIEELTKTIEEKSKEIKTKQDYDAFKPFLTEFTEKVNSFLVLLNKQIFTSTNIAKRYIIDKYKNKKIKDNIINIFINTIRDTVIDRVTFSNKTNIQEASKANEDARKLIQGNDEFLTKEECIYTTVTDIV